MLRRKILSKSSPGKKRNLDEEPIASNNPILYDVYEDTREALLEEEVLGTEEHVINVLPSFDSGERKAKKKKKSKNEEEAVKKWADSDDEHTAEFDVVNPSWAGKFDEENSEDSDEEALKAHSQNILAASTCLPPTSLDFKRVTDGNKEEPSQTSLKSVEFHPKATVLLTGGPDNTVRLFAVDGSKNRKIHSIFFERTPVLCTHFSRGGSEIIVGSKHKSFYIYDMEGSSGITFRPKLKGLEVSAMSKFVVSPDGRFLAFLGTFGYIHLFSQTNKELIDSVKMNGSVTSVSFSSDGRFMYTFGSEGHVYVWDMDTRDCVHHFSDEGCIDGTSVTVSPNNKYLVCGSGSGIVSIYDRESAMLSRVPKPLKHVKNLTTKCSGVLFNSQSEILAIRSNDSEKAIRLVHFPSLTVLKNFPDQQDHDMKVLTCMDFSPSSGYLAAGNVKGRCLLYRLHHYTKY
jgi:U3 small nucleolar RNA-associated protein 18